MKKRTVMGEYNRESYEVLLHGPRGTASLYTGSNHRQDSGQYAPLGSPEAMSLRQMRAACIYTTRDLAEERKAVYGGVERIREEIVR